LIGALQYALANGYDGLRAYADSELMVRQINGVYKVKSPDLQPLFREAKALISKLKSFSIHHVPREQNREADRLANLAMDGGQTKESAREVPPRSQRIQAVYREGCFHPIESVDLPENTRVDLKIKIAEDA
jgi:ribonuclease HI